MKEIEVSEITELDRNEVYLVQLPQNCSVENAQEFARQFAKHQLKAVFTLGEVKLATLTAFISQSSAEQKAALLSALQSEGAFDTEVIDATIPEGSEINPVAHEQTK